jgi:hypothetical protein
MDKADFETRVRPYRRVNAVQHGGVSGRHVAPRLVGVQPAPARVASMARQELVHVGVRHADRVNLGCRQGTRKEGMHEG